MTEQPASTPPGLEPVWMVEATYVANAAEVRVPYRPDHLANLLELKESGVVLEAGAYADASASVLMLRAASEENAVEICRNDVYWQNGVWVELKARAFMRVP